MTFAALTGLSLASIAPASGLYAAASGSYLEEDIGSEEVTSLYTQSWVNGWYSCNGTNCTAAGDYMRIAWTIPSGSSFDGIWGYAAGPVPYFCNGAWDTRQVYAGSGSGADYLYNIDGACTVGYGSWWQWLAGMCDSWGSDCWAVWNATGGPHAGWYWTAPSGSAFNFYYLW